jgi:hypothetical protein
MTSTEDFVAQMAWACAPLTRPDHQFVAFQPGSYSETTEGLDTNASLCVLVYPEAIFTTLANVKNVATGAEPTKGIISFKDGTGHRWEFYCELVSNQMQVTPMAIMRQRAELSEDILVGLNRLGGTMTAIRRRLSSMNLAPNLSGIVDFIYRMFGLEIEIKLGVENHMEVPEITGQRLGPDHEVLFTVVLRGCFSHGMTELLKRELLPQ